MTAQMFERRVLTLAACVIADPVQISTWYRCDPIAALGGCTAQTLVAAGAGHEVVGFLLDVLCLERAGATESVMAAPSGSTQQCWR